MSTNLSLSQIAQRWNRSYSTVHRIVISQNRLKHFKVGRQWFAPLAEVEAFEKSVRPWGRKRLGDN